MSAVSAAKRFDSNLFASFAQRLARRSAATTSLGVAQMRTKIFALKTLYRGYCGHKKNLYVCRRNALYAKSPAKLRNFLLCDFVYLILHGFGKAGVVAVGAGRHLVPVAQSHVKAALGAAVLALAGLFTRIYGMCHNLPPDI